MVQIKLIVESMKVQIIKAFDVTEISNAILIATEKAVDDFDMSKYIKLTIEDVIIQARDKAIEQLLEKYSDRWADEL